MSTIARSAASAHAAARPRWIDRLGRRVALTALERLRDGRVTLIDSGERWSGGAAKRPGVEVFVQDPRFYGAVAFGGSVGAAEAYIDGHWDCDDLAGLFETLVINSEAMGSVDGPLRRLSEPLSRLGYALQRNSRPGSRRNIRAHYDLSNEFFALWLDPTMTYSCAYFERPDATLEEAQRAKLDLACRKLDLKPTDHLLEIGTGWGSAAVHAASVYGCRVTTTTISEQQFREASRRVEAAGLEDRVTLLRRDYRDLEGRFDKALSIEMIEAVGRQYLDGFMAKMASLLNRDGLALIQAITIADQRWASAARRRDFLKKHIFPGSCLLGVERLARAARTSTDMRVLDLEDIGQHYVQTLRRWSAAFETQAEAVRELGFDERFMRMWRYYLAYCEGVFRTGYCSDVQVLLGRPRARPRLAARAQVV